MRVLVTGGAGFIGSAMVRYLVGEERVRVLNVDKLTYASNLASLAPIASDPNYALLKADICDSARMAATFAEFQPDGLFTWPPKPMSIVRLRARRPSSKPTSTALTHCWRRHVDTSMVCQADGATRFAFFTSPPMKSTARLVPPVCSRKAPPMIRARLIRRARQHPIIWSWRGAGPTDFQRSSRTVPIIMDLISFPRSSSR